MNYIYLIVYRPFREFVTESSWSKDIKKARLFNTLEQAESWVSRRTTSTWFTDSPYTKDQFEILEVELGLMRRVEK